MSISTREAPVATREQPQTAPVRRAGRRPGGVSVGLLCLVVGILVVPPLISVVIRSFTSTTVLGAPGDATLDNFQSLLSQKGLGRIAFNTLLTTVGSTALAILVGGGLAWVAERTNAPGATLCRLVMLTSLSIPYILYSIAWIMLLGPDGPINSVTGVVGITIGAHSLAAMILVEGLIASPLAFLFMAAVLRTIDASLEEAAAMSGASSLRVLLRITGPLALPGVLGVGLLIFIRTLEAFEIPALIGLPGGIRVMTTSIFLDTQKFPPDYGTAGAYAVVLMLAVIVLLSLSARLNRRAEAFASLTGKPTRPRKADLGGKRWFGSAAIGAFAVLALLGPMMIILWASLVSYYHAPSISGLGHLTLHNYSYLWRQGTFLPAVQNTVIVGVAAATAITAIAAIGVWLNMRLKAPGGWFFEQMSMVPLIIPGVILGFSMSALYLSVPLPIYATLWILLIGYTARYLPYGIRYASAGMIQIHGSLEEAAGVSGARHWTTFRRIVLPLARPALLSGWVFIFLMASKELSMAVLLASPGNEVLSVSIYHQWINGQTTQVATIGVLWAGSLALVMVGLMAFTRRRGVRLDV